MKKVKNSEKKYFFTLFFTFLHCFYFFSLFFLKGRNGMWKVWGPSEDIQITNYGLKGLVGGRMEGIWMDLHILFYHGSRFVKENFMSDKKRTTFFHLFFVLVQKRAYLSLVLPPLHPHS